ncbi:hypothetical protein AVEN_267172-1 [Araneus ventricosus]|uniref:DNA-directed DNA polymerase n=1 Tax=Araneus ventricosus TaxID=182803 RepID=A0A4Y2JRR6_ARAVE|nr:hypothetical protein AVEN_267172-1 [Araneus ventricosus]
MKRKPKDHKCGERECKNCRKWVDKDHKCYMKTKKALGGLCQNSCFKRQTYKECVSCKQSEGISCMKTCKIREPDKSNDWCDQCKYADFSEKYFFFDLETMQETGNHVVKVVINHDFHCNKTFFNDENEYCTWLFDRKHSGYTVLAHYGKGFNFQFLAKYCFKNKIKVFTIYQGNKLIYMQASDYNIRFIDSINFTLNPLRIFPKTYGLTELAKGYLPHLFNTKSNQNYIGKYPDKCYYGYDSMTEDQRKTFDKWYETVKHETFDFRKEIIKYCDSDVDILRRGCLELRKLFLKTADIDPFRYVTLAGVCMAIYRNNFLKENTIAIDEDVIQQDQYSEKSIAWLDYLSQKHNINIQHALNIGEKKLILGNKPHKVDGFYENAVYQFQGCYWHGCPKCFRESTVNMHNQICMKDLYEKTKKINSKIEDAGYELIQIWECDFNDGKDIKKYMKKEWKRDFVTPLNPRDAFYGGGCEPTTLKYEMKDNEKDRYIDVCSLYPTVNFFDCYPTGHPEKIKNPKKCNKKWYGLIKCKILPPRKLYHPVLPYKEEKVIFSLCKLCSETIKCKHHKTVSEKKRCKEYYEIRNKECNHTDDERSFIGTWTTPEVKLAIQKGYQILNIYEVWNFNTRSDTLFKDFVKMFLKIKLETDDKWSENFKTEEEYRRYVKKKLDIELGEIKKNPGMRFIAKICLNSLWGKFGQRKNMSQTEYVNELEDFYRIILNDNIKDLNMMFMNDDCVEMNYKMKDAYVKDNFNTNIYIAAFTTS